MYDVYQTFPIKMLHIKSQLNLIGSLNKCVYLPKLVYLSFFHFKILKFFI